MEHRPRIKCSGAAQTFREIMAVECNNHTKDMHRVSGQNTEISTVTAGEMCLCHEALH